MANQEQLDILKQGPEVWNQWRKEHPEIKPDLRDANLSRANLSRANLSRANLNRANLNRANLSHANLIGANLIGANLSHANLIGADLGGANLSHANLSDANLSRADLNDANLSSQNFIDANFSSADLRRANLSDAVLIGQNLSDANLSDANLRDVNLSDANLSDADLSGADLSGANLSGADLSGADLNCTNLIMVLFLMARLINARLDCANLTDACLWETQRAGWSIKGVICESVYWDEEREVKTAYNPGDFERLFADKTKIRLFFKDGISPLEIATLPALIKHLEEAHPGCGLRLVSIHDDAGGAVVELAIEDDDEKSPQQMKQLQAALEAEAQQRIEYQRRALVEREARLQLEGEVKQLDAVVDKLIRRHTINIQGDHMGDKYEISGQAGAVGPDATAYDNTFNQLVNHVEQNVDLAELAKQLGELRQALAQKQDSPQAAIAIGEVAKAEIAATEKHPAKVVEHLKAAGKWTLDFAKDIGKDLIVDVIKKAGGIS